MRRARIRYQKGDLSRAQVEIEKSGKLSRNQENLEPGEFKKKSNQEQKPSRQRNLQAIIICTSLPLSLWQMKMSEHLITYDSERR